METTQTAAPAKKWTSTAGPRQTKAVNEALSKINWEGKAYIELWGTIGGEEHRSILTPMFGSTSEAARAELAAIAEKYEYTVTVENHKAIIADATAAIPRVIAARPIVDKRRTPEQEADRIKQSNEAEAKRQAENKIKEAQNAEEKTRLLKDFPYLERLDQTTKSGHALTGANIRLILKKHFPGHTFKVTTSSFAGGDSCDVSWTDGPTEKEVKSLIGRFEAGSFDGMEDMYNYRADVWHGLFGDVKYLFAGRNITPEKYIEAGKQENIPVFLTEHGGLDRGKMDECSMRRISEAVNKTSYYTAPTTPAQDQSSDSTPQETTAGAATIRRNTEKGGIEIKYPDKPGPAVLEALHAAGWHWSRFNKVWYKKDTPENWTEAEKLAAM